MTMLLPINGRLNTDHIRYSYLLSELVEQYQIETARVFNYEEFFDWFVKKSGSDDIKDYCTTVNNRLTTELSYQKDSGYLFQSMGCMEWHKSYEIINYLIADLLVRPYQRGREYIQLPELSIRSTGVRRELIFSRSIMIC